MSNGTRLFLAVLATYLITHAGYWALKFNPLKDLHFWPGLVVDFTIWVVVFYIAKWVISKSVAPKPARQ